MERIVGFPVRTILTVLGLIVAVWALLHVVVTARSVLVYIFIAIFLTLAINPLVALLMRRGVRSRAVASGTACLLVLLAIAAIGYAFIPTVIDNVNNFVDAVPGYVHDLTKGRGRLGFLETKYHVVEKLQHYVKHGGAKKLLGLWGAAVSVTKGVLNFIVGTVTVAFLTFFMLLEGPAWMERFYGLLPPESQPRWRAVGHEIYRQVGGYVTGNLAISLIAGSLATFVLIPLGVPFAVAPRPARRIARPDSARRRNDRRCHRGRSRVPALPRGRNRDGRLLHPLPAIREPRPAAAGLQPDGRTVTSRDPHLGARRAELAGVLGALGAIPVAGAIQVLIVDFLRARRERAISPASG